MFRCLFPFCPLFCFACISAHQRDHESSPGHPSYLSGRGYINRGHLWGGVCLPSSRDDCMQPGAVNMPSKVTPSGTLPFLLHPQWTGHRLIESLDARFWTNIYSAEVTSNVCLVGVRALLSCRSGMSVARNFQGNEAQKFIDFLDQVSCKTFAPCLGNLGC